MHRHRVWLLVFLFGLAACFSPGRATTGRGTGGPSRYTETGLASWYGRAHHRHWTANGERFNMNAMTAAHRSLPFGSRVRVTNLETGKTVMVRINDRGPYVKGRIIDLSRAAASALGIREGGVAQVGIEVLSSDQPRRIATAAGEAAPSQTDRSQAELCRNC